MRPTLLGPTQIRPNPASGLELLQSGEALDATPGNRLLPSPAVPRSGRLAQLSDELLKDIDAQMRSLPAEEQKRLKPHFTILLDASLALTDRDTPDGASFDPRSLEKCRQALAKLKTSTPPASSPSQHKGRASPSPQYGALRHTLRQLASHLEGELAATLRAARRLEPSRPMLAVDKPLSAEEVRQHILKFQATGNGKAGTGLPRGAGQSLMEILYFVTLEPNEKGEHWLTPGMDRRATESLRSRHTELSAALEQLRSANLSDIAEPMGNALKNLVNLATARLESMQLHLDICDEYQSPDSIANICHARQLEIDAAIRVLESHNDAGNQTPLIDALKVRRHRLDLLALAPGDADAHRLLGKKAMSGLARLLHPIDAARQAVKLEKAGERWLSAAAKGAAATRRLPLELDGFNEPLLMEWLLKKAGIADAGKAFRAAHRRVLDSRPFDVIRSDIVVPMQGAEAPQRLKASTTPASHVLCDASRICFADDNPVLNPANMRQYLHEGDRGQEIRGGFNSHDTAEHLHPTLAAHDDLTMQGQTLFGATRHGVTAPYSLAQELKSMPDEQALALVRQLLGAETRPPTRATLAWQAGSPLASPAQQAMQARIPNTVRSDFQALLQQKIDAQNQLDETLIESFVFDEEDRSTLSGKSADDLMSSDRDLLLEMIRKHADLQDLLVRQAALNRARELVLLEIARDPRMEKKIAAGETVLFTSISLLTPDALRHHLSELAGETGFDERKMLEIQLKAWEDLEKEIEQGGIEINGQRLKAAFCPFNFGVNDMALLGPGSDPVIGEAVSGHDFANRCCNEASLEKLVGLTDAVDTPQAASLADQAIARMQAALEQPNAGAERAVQLAYDLKVVQQLQAQIRQIREDGSYRRAGNEPYKLASRIALLSFLIEGGTLFNCKSGKDRTGQLSVETKFLALRIRDRDGSVPDPDAESTPWEHVQYGCLLFFDKARTRMQKYATGYEGSKLGYAKRAFAYFSQAFRQLPKSEGLRMAETQLREFIGLSSRTKF